LTLRFGSSTLVGKVYKSLPDYSRYTDYALLDAIRDDDEKAFAELFKRYWRKVHAMAYTRVRSKVVTEEIVQDLFISLWDRRATQSIQHLSSYLYQSVKFKVLNHIESKLVVEKYWDYYKEFIPQKENATDIAVGYNDLIEAIEDGMQQLPEKSKKVFRLNRLEGHSVSEIADLLNLSEKAIQYHLTQSVKKLRMHLKNYILSLAVFIGFLD
jgi:RNA polymerase sigma-70 factor (family 1)